MQIKVKLTKEEGKKAIGNFILGQFTRNKEQFEVDEIKIDYNDEFEVTLQSREESDEKTPSDVVLPSVRPATPGAFIATGVYAATQADLAKAGIKYVTVSRGMKYAKMGEWWISPGCEEKK